MPLVYTSYFVRSLRLWKIIEFFLVPDNSGLKFQPYGDAWMK